MPKTFSNARGQGLLQQVKTIFEGRKVYEKRDRHIVFVCGAKAEDLTKRRAKFLRFATTALPDVVTVLAEKAYGRPYFNEPPRFGNLSDFEELMGSFADCVLVFPESIGSYAEIGVFSCREMIRKKVLVANDNQDGSFINLGPIRTINDESMFNPTLIVDNDDEASFHRLKTRLRERLGKTLTDRVVPYMDYTTLRQEHKIVIAALAMVMLLSIVNIKTMYAAVKGVFGDASWNVLKDVLSILVASGHLSTKDSYFFSNGYSNQLVKFDASVCLSEFNSDAILYYRAHEKDVYEALQKYRPPGDAATGAIGMK